MVKRFTDTDKWNDPWFRQLPGVEKLIFLYVIDRCNNAGFWEIDNDAIAWHTKVNANLIEGAWKGLGRGIKIVDGWAWVRRFLRHQKNEIINSNNPAHKQIIAQIEDQLERFKSCAEFNEFIRGCNGSKKPLFSPIGTGTGKGTKKKEDKNSDEYTEGRRPKPDTLQAVEQYCDSLKLPRADASYFWHKWLGNGFKNGGHKMRDWQSVIRSWRDAGHCPSQKNGQQRLPLESKSKVV